MARNKISEDASCTNPDMGTCTPQQEAEVKPDYESMFKCVTYEQKELIAQNQALKQEVELLKAASRCIEENIKSLYLNATLLNHKEK